MDTVKEHDRAMKTAANDTLNAQARSQAETTVQVTREKARAIVKALIADVVSNKKPLVGNQIGAYNRQFARLWEPEFKRSFGSNGSKID